MSILSAHLVIQSPGFREWIRETVKDPDIFEALHKPSKGSDKNVFQSEILGAKFEPVSRGPFSKLYTMFSGEIGPRKADQITTRLIDCLSRMQAKDDATFESGIRRLNTLIDRSLGLCVSEGLPEDGLTLEITRSLESPEYRRAFSLLSPASLGKDSDQELLRQIDRGSTITSVVIKPFSTCEPFDAQDVANALYLAPFARQIKSIEISGTSGNPLEVENIDSITSGTQQSERLVIRDCILTEVESNVSSNWSLKEIVIDTEEIPLEEITEILPFCYELEKLDIKAHSATTLQIAELLSKVCRFSSNNVDISIQVVNKDSFAQSTDSRIAVISEELKRQGISTPKSLVLDI